nr:uncharacterized protein LOC104651462 [Saimiri boliviensis boliviensis]XP_010337292.1 uncharacterized protein LOC104651462 [Saimiri boliviensis boliviensis]
MANQRTCFQGWEESEGSGETAQGRPEGRERRASLVRQCQRAAALGSPSMCVQREPCDPSVPASLVWAQLSQTWRVLPACFRGPVKTLPAHRAYPHFLICRRIQATWLRTLVKTAGSSIMEQPIPQLTTPTWTQEPPFLQTRGPPESPFRERTQSHVSPGAFVQWDSLSSLERPRLGGAPWGKAEPEGLTMQGPRPRVPAHSMSSGMTFSLALACRRFLAKPQDPWRLWTGVREAGLQL